MNSDLRLVPTKKLPKKRRNIIDVGPFIQGHHDDILNNIRKCPKCKRVLKHLGGGLYQCKICHKVFNDKELAAK